ncbi:copper resistance system multicopper oxidase [Thiolapillus sp.]
MKYRKNVFSGGLASPTRRRFVQGLAMGSMAAGLGLGSRALWASADQQQKIPTLSGTDFDLSIGEQVVNFTGTPRIGTTVNGSLPAPILRWKEGDTVTLRVKNNLPETSSIHWHGIILPSSQDGVPDISDGFSGIAPGTTHTYSFKVVQSGTYWYHSHSGFQEQTGLYGPIIIDPKEPEPFTYDRDYVVMLSDWTDEDPTVVYAKLKKLSHYYNFNERTHKDLMKDLKEKGLARTWSERKMWMQMRMSQRDLADVTGYTYTYLMNGQTPADGWTGLFRKGEKVRLRFINGSAMSFFDVRIPGLKMTVVAADGQYVQPVSVDEFRIGVAETYDVIVEPDDGAYTIFAQSIDRSGYARGTLTPDLGMTAEVPVMDPVPDLTHTDMGMDMSGMNHGMHGMDMKGMDHSQHQMGGMDRKGRDHSQHQMGGMDMKGMDHSQHQMGGMDRKGMDHSQHQMGDMKMPMGKPAHPSDFTGGKVTHAATEYGPQVDMRADAPRYRLDDPGVGLRNNGRRVLTYADLKHLHGTNDPREPDREIQLHLTGNMSRYMWSVNGVKFADAEPLRWKMGERLRITFVNDTMMNHPMHLHGMWSDLETGDNDYIPRKHTVIVQPGSRISYRVTVDAEGGWAYHCHLLYHMLGMFREVQVS